MQRYLSINKDKECNKEVRFQNPNNEICGDIKFNQNGKLKNLSDIIPSEANSDNKLVDKNTLEREIEVADATFRGTYYSETKLPTTGIDKNDYAFVVVSSDEKKTYKKFKWTKKEDGSWGWVWEYDLEIDSKIVPTKVSELEDDLHWGEHILQIDSSISELNGKIDEIDSSISELEVKKLDIEQLTNAALEAVNALNDEEYKGSIEDLLKKFFNHFIPTIDSSISELEVK